jgi:ribokinase
MQRIISFGSLNMDLVAVGGPIPQPGETVTAQQLRRVPGGKGANQAVGAARQGAPTLMVGRVGSDAFGDDLLAALAREQVDISAVMRDADSSGVALIMVNPAGENAISVIAGANGNVDLSDVLRLQERLQEPAIVLLQLEVPLAAVTAAAAAARRAGATVILDPAPAQPLPDELVRLISILTPNQHEAATLVGFTLDSDAAIVAAAAELQRRGAAQVVIKLGGRGAYALDQDGRGRWIAAHPVTVVDTVAAGDAFNAGLAAGLAAGQSFTAALQRAAAAGALAVTRAGAQDAMPGGAETLALAGLGTDI